MADIYTIFNYLEKNKVYLSNSDLGHRIITCLFPILPKLTMSLNKNLFNKSAISDWPEIRKELLIEEDINLPIQIQGRLVTTISTKKGYDENELLNAVYQLDKIKIKIKDKKIAKVINVQDKIINIITF